jgi:hypothetical protein
MARNQVDFTYDNLLLMKDAGLVAASAAATVATVAKILDMGASRNDARVILDFTAVEADTNDERYDIILQGSNSATFAGGGTPTVNLGAILMGDATTTLETVDTAIGRRELAFCTEVNGVTYRYVRLYTRVVGTIATGINFTAYVVQEA